MFFYKLKYLLLANQGKIKKTLYFLLSLSLITGLAYGTYFSMSSFLFKAQLTSTSYELRVKESQTSRLFEVSDETLYQNEAIEVAVYDKSAGTQESSVNWTTTDSSIIDVNNGRVQAKNVGEAFLVATVNGEELSAPFNVLKNNYSLYINGELAVNQTLNVNDALSLELKDKNGNALNGASFYSSNQDAVSVNQSGGTLQAVKAGQSFVYASYDGIESSKIVVTVSSGFSLNGNREDFEMSATMGDMFILKALESGTESENVVWSFDELTSGGDRMQSASSQFHYIPKVPGKMEVVATNSQTGENIKAIINVVESYVDYMRIRELSSPGVFAPVSKLGVNSSKNLVLVAKFGGSDEINSEESGYFSENPVSWRTSDTDIISVGENGSVIGLKEGTATVEAAINIRGEEKKAYVSIDVLRGVLVDGFDDDYEVEVYAGATKDFTIAGVSALDQVQWKNTNIDADRISVEEVNSGGVKNLLLHYQAPDLLAVNKKFEYFEVEHNNRVIRVQINVNVPRIAQLKIAREDSLIDETTSSTLIVGAGQEIPLKLIAKLENNQLLEWRAGALNSQVFINPTWTVEDTNVGEINASGLFTAKNAGATSVYVQVGSDMEDEEGHIMYIAPTATIHIKVNPAFRINGLSSSEQNYDVPAGSMFSFKADNTSQVDWNLSQNNSGAKILESEDPLILNYQAGENFDVSEVSDVIEVTSAENVTYNLLINVVPAVLEEVSLSLSEAVIREGESSALILNYRLSGDDSLRTVNFSQDSLPSILGSLDFNSSDSSVAQVENGVIRALKKGNTFISMKSSLNPDLESSLYLEVEAKAARFIEGSTKIAPAFPEAGAKIRVETEVYFEDGADSLQEVRLKFASSYLEDKLMLKESEYQDAIQSRTGVVNPFTKSEQSTEEEESLVRSKYVVDYQLPGYEFLNGQTVSYTIIATTAAGESFSQAGSLNIGSVVNICSKENRLTCLLRGLRCLKEKALSKNSPECNKVIELFTSDPVNFSIRDVWRKYQELR